MCSLAPFASLVWPTNVLVSDVSNISLAYLGVLPYFGFLARNDLEGDRASLSIAENQNLHNPALVLASILHLRSQDLRWE